jgi:hypothetical protein
MQNASKIHAFVDRSLRNAVATWLIWIPFCIGSSAPCSAQEAAQSTEAAVLAGSPVVPQQVRYAGKLCWALPAPPAFRRQFLPAARHAGWA